MNLALEILLDTNQQLVKNPAAAEDLAPYIDKLLHHVRNDSARGAPLIDTSNPDEFVALLKENRGLTEEVEQLKAQFLSVPDPLLSPAQVEEYSGGVFSQSLLNIDRCKGKSVARMNLPRIPFRKIGQRAYYLKSDIDAALRGKQEKVV